MPPLKPATRTNPEIHLSQRANHISDLRKALPKDCESSVLPAYKMIDAVDSSPFCQLQEATGANFVVFVEKDHNTVYEIFCKWVRQVSKDSDEVGEVSANSGDANQSDFLVCRKGSLMRISKDTNTK